jgi:hexosaminidase
VNARHFCTGAIALALAACRPDAPAPRLTQPALDAIAASLVVNVALHENRGGGGCVANVDGPCYTATLTLTSPIALDASPFEIYYHQEDPLVAATSTEFRIDHRNGDLYRIATVDAYQGFRAGERKTIALVGGGTVLTDAKFMPNYYAVADGLAPRVIASTRVRIDAETGLEIRPYAEPLTMTEQQFRSAPDDRTPPATAAWLYEHYGDLTPSTGVDVIVPAPARMTLVPNARRIDLARGIALTRDSIARAPIAAALDHLARLGVPERADGIALDVRIDANATPGAEGYRLRIGREGIDVVARDTAGAYYAVQSLAALLAPGRTDVPPLVIEDAPRYAFRGMHVDVARNFHGKRAILALLDAMGAYKLNRLHFHLADDEAWRVEIDGLPELTGVGGARCHDPAENRCLMPSLGSGPGGERATEGYYTAQDYIEIVRAAAQRHIQVIPSFDMPGHSRALVKAMEARHRRLLAAGDRDGAERYLASDPDDRTVYRSIQYYDDNTLNVCLESTYRLIDGIVGEVARLHAAAGAPLTLYHIGADETAGAWKDSPACRAYLARNDAGITRVDQLGGHFIARVAAMLEKRGIRVGAWSDGLEHADASALPPDVQSNAWGLLDEGAHATAHAHANRGWQVVLSLPDVLYFDFPYAADPAEHGYHWAARHVDERKVWELMPDNLPAHAAIWTDARGHALTIDDTVQRDANGRITRQPLRDGVRIAGFQGNAWGETVRSDALLDHLVFPRLLALAERAWHRAAWEPAYRHEGATYSATTGLFTPEQQAQREADWARFASALGTKELPKLDAAGVAFRIPPPGAIVREGVLHARVPFPGIAIEYRADGGAWHTYTTPVRVDANVVEVRSIVGKRRSRSVSVAIANGSAP